MFTDKVVLITGASSGIGMETAFDFAKLNANLVLSGRNERNLNSMAKQCQEYSPSNLIPLVIVADVNKETEIENLLEATIIKFEKLDVLVNNAGILASGTIENTSLEQYDNIMSTNIRGPYYLTMLAVPHLVKSKGNIVNISSVGGLRAFPNVLSYCISKAALEQFTRCVAIELGAKGVRVNSVSPGGIITGIHLKGTMTDQEYEEYLEKCKIVHALGRAGNPREVSSVITFLASKAASNITGATIPVDGGRQAMVSPIHISL